MGMGDKQIPFTPSYEPVFDDVLHRMFAPILMRECPNEAVIRRYGTGGKANVSIYVCKKCRYGIKHRDMGAWNCGLELQTRKTNVVGADRRSDT